MAELHLKPAREGDIIRDPASGRILPPEGETKPRTTHWLRRLDRGEVVLTNAKAIAEGKAAREAAEKEAAEAAEKAAAEAAKAAEPTPEPAPETEAAEIAAKPRKTAKE